jgi:hypothetical protein
MALALSIYNEQQQGNFCAYFSETIRLEKRGGGIKAEGDSPRRTTFMHP